VVGGDIDHGDREDKRQPDFFLAGIYYQAEKLRSEIKKIFLKKGDYFY
jgi:hypothetical protein